MFEELIRDTIQSSFPVLAMVLVTAILLRYLYFKYNRHKFRLHKELMHLIFVTYILLLFMLLSKSDMNSVNGFNLTPFEEILRHDFLSSAFNYNVLGNIFIFIPLGYYVGYYIKSKEIKTTFLASFIISLSVEFIQYFIGRSFDIDDIILNVVGAMLGFIIYKFFFGIKKRLPNFMQKDGLWSILCIIMVTVITLYILDVLGVFSL